MAECQPMTRKIFGMRAAATQGAVWTMLALACAAALAQDLGTAAYTPVSPPANPTDEPAVLESSALSPNESALLGNALTFDPSNLASTAPAKPLRLPGLSNRNGLDVSRTAKPDGSSTVVVKQPLPIDWEAKVGADLGLAATATDSYQPGSPMPWTRDGRGSGAAWASVGVSNLATLDARVDPSNDQGKVGTTLKHSMPVGSTFSVTLQNSYSVTETFGPPAAAASDLPLMAVPTVAATQPMPHVWGNEKIAKFDILPSGTTLAAGLASTSSDPVTHNKLSAEQQLYGPLHVTTAVTDVGQPSSSKSITAGFKLNW